MMNNQYTGNYERLNRDKDDCCTVVKKCVGVKTPVSVDVSTRSGDIKIICGKPRIIDDMPPSSPQRCGHNAGKCEFTVNQTICVEIPISYRVRTDVKDSFVDCDVHTEC